ncbi:hypothetical protein B0H19DRAFT_1275946 [Mycena capillaripes]|nr:hypothetical protein B0H19DRAFT_1275946 [Mycena capillaripes]
MAQYGLDIDSREHIANRWSQQWSRRFEKSKTDTHKLLYLCACGYNHHQRNTKYDHAQNVNGEPDTQQRHTAALFTGCLAHAEITTRSHKIVRIRGHFDHNDSCKKALYERIPPIPVHPSVYVAALAQLRDGASFSGIRCKNREFLQAKAYKDFPHDLASSQFRWILTHNDSRSLYRQYNRMKGSEKYNPTLAHTIFHYSARAEKGERFEIILDGTFGVCDSRLLLFIVMAVDEDRKGVPVAFLLFSAPSGNKQTSADYDTSILEKLLRKWFDLLNNRGMNVPAIPIPRSLAEAQALQAAAVLTITIRLAKAELPTSRAAGKFEDILREDDWCMESDSDGEDAAADDDNAATDTSSDSE